MGDADRFYVVFEKHIGLGIRWERENFWLDLSIGVPFVSFVIGIGSRR